MSTELDRTDLQARAPDAAELKEQEQSPEKAILPVDSQSKELIYRKSEPLNGIIRHLTRECGGNIYDKGVVNIMGIGWDIKNILAMIGSCYCTYETENAWICYDFNDRRVIPTSYALRSHHNVPGGNHLKSWVAENFKRWDRKTCGR